MSAQRVPAKPEYTFDIASAAVAQPTVRRETLNSLHLYVEFRLGPGSFLRAVLENNLDAACEHADHDQLQNLGAIVAVCRWYVPQIAWGSRTKVNDWLQKKERVA